MAEINIEKLKRIYLNPKYCSISGTDAIIDEAIASAEQIFLRNSEDEVYHHSRPLAIAYIALIEAKNERNRVNGVIRYGNN